MTTEKETHPFLEIKNISKSFPVASSGGVKKLHALEDVSLKIVKGRTFGLVGESGCGKSTLGKIVVGIEQPDKGQVLFEGQPVWGKKQRINPEVRRNFQMIFQDPYSSLNPRQKIGSCIGEALNIHSVGNRTFKAAKVAELMDSVGLRPELANRYPHEFSGGQRQRVSIARALSLSPSLIVCDEPVSALDVSIQAQIINLLKEIQRNTGVSYLFISHDLAIVKTMCHFVAVMYLGRIVESAPNKELYARPMHPYTQALLDAVPIPDPSRTEKHIGLSGETPSPISPPSGCHFHPRCPHKMDICSRQSPPKSEIEEGHWTHCWLHA